jgi:putative DNA primase/helicase
MTEAQVGWTARVEETFQALRFADRDAQELACQSIEDAGSAGKLRELFEADRAKFEERAAEITAAIEKAEASPVEKPDEQPKARPKIEIVKGGSFKGRFLSILAKEKKEEKKVGEVVQLKPREQAKPEPEPKPEPQEGRAEFANEQGTEDDSEPLLSKATPYDSAKEFVRRHWIKDGVLTLYWWEGKWWRWNGVCYKEMLAATIDKEVWAFLNGARTGIERDRFRPKPNDVEGVIKALKAGCGHTLDPPYWLDSRGSAEGLLVFQNGIVDMKTGKLERPTPKLWTMNALDFEYDPKARCPVWDRFLDEVFEGDDESREVIEEWLGLGMTDDIRFHKGFLYVGTKGREGKGTLAHIQEKLCGSAGYVSLSFDDWLKGEYSKEAMLYKRAGVFFDVRLKEGKLYGQNYDPGGIDHVSKEWLLRITAGDGVTIRRKWNSVAWEGALPMKVTLISNEIPNLNDPNLVTRFIKIAFGVSFRGREDINLQSKLKVELPGIANRCLEGYRRLCRRGRFIHGLKLERELSANSNPWEAFFQEHCVLDPAGSVKCGVLYMKFKLWCGEHGRNDLLVKQATSSPLFSKLLKKKVPALKDVETIRLGGIREHIGIRLKTKSEKEADEG